MQPYDATTADHWHSGRSEGSTAKILHGYSAAHAAVKVSPAKSVLERNTSIKPVRLVLVGAGHAHVEVLRRLILTPQPGVQLTLISLDDQQHYSGMVPGYLRGTYCEEEIAFDLPALARRAGGRFIRGQVSGIDPHRRRVRLTETEDVSYDFVSFNIGSGAAGADTEIVARYAVPVKPLSQAVLLRQRIRMLVEGSGNTLCHVVVVGGGAAGVEIACALAAVFDQTGRRWQVSIFEASDTLLANYAPRLRYRAEQILARKGIAVYTRRRVWRVHPDAVDMEDGSSMPSALTVWLGGAAAPRLFRDSGLEVDPNGFLLVDDALRAMQEPHIFGAGDCATLTSYPDTPKAGVYAVRQAPVLWQSLLAAVDGRQPPRYEPQPGFLSILNTADGKALLRYKTVVSYSRWAWLLKDWIDRRFMAKYQRLVRENP